MSYFRSPIHLDLESLIPLANYHGIEVMTEIQLSERDLGKRGGSAAGKMGIPGGSNIELGGSRGSETEVMQARTVKDHPASALNRLIDALDASNDLSHLAEATVAKRMLVEVDSEWQISPATDLGGLFQGMTALMAGNPSFMDSPEIPPEAMSLMVGGSPTRGTVVLEAVELDPQGRKIVALLSPEDITAKNTVDDLEGDRTLFGTVQELIPEGKDYSLEKVFLAGFNRSIRRSFKMDKLLEVGKTLGRPIDEQDLRIQGPLVVVKSIAMY